MPQCEEQTSPMLTVGIAILRFGVSEKVGLFLVFDTQVLDAVVDCGVMPQSVYIQSETSAARCCFADTCFQQSD